MSEGNTDHTNKTAAKRHDGHTTGDALQEDILNRRKGESKVRAQKCEYAKAHEGRGHTHDGDPSRLQAKVYIGGTDHRADC